MADRTRLIKALMDFQAEAPVFRRSAEAQTGSRSYKYVPLDDILPEVTPLLAKNGLVWLTWPEMRGVDTPALHYELVHVGGSSLSGLMPLGLDKTFRMQEYGSALTYARRYAMGAVLGLVLDDDDDGKAASGEKRKAGTKPKARPVEQTPTPASAGQRNTVNKHAGELGVSAPDLANAIKKVMGQPEVQWDDPVAAEKWIVRAMDRFPAKKVTELLAEIDLRPGPAQRGQTAIEYDPETGEVK